MEFEVDAYKKSLRFKVFRSMTGATGKKTFKPMFTLNLCTLLNMKILKFNMKAIL